MPPAARPRAVRRAARLLAAAVALLAGAVAGLLWPVGPAPSEPNDSGTTVEGQIESSPIPAPPSRPDGAAVEVDPAAEAAVVALAGRFGVDDPAGVGGGGVDSGAILADLVGRLRYRGARLSAAERSALADEPDAVERGLALAWDERVGRHALDRPLPADFRDGPIRWQLDAVAWALGVEGWRPAAGDRRATAEAVHALGEALAVDLPTRPSPLAGRYPALGEYARFLSRLPRR